MQKVLLIISQNSAVFFSSSVLWGIYNLEVMGFTNLVLEKLPYFPDHKMHQDFRRQFYGISILFTFETPFTNTCWTKGSAIWIFCWSYSPEKSLCLLSHPSLLLCFNLLKKVHNLKHNLWQLLIPHFFSHLMLT
jgi:hypothetical protein